MGGLRKFASATFVDFHPRSNHSRHGLPCHWAAYWRLCSQCFWSSRNGHRPWTPFTMAWLQENQGNLNRKTMFLPSNIVVSCKFSHHPVLWPLQFDHSWVPFSIPQLRTLEKLGYSTRKKMETDQGYWPLPNFFGFYAAFWISQQCWFSPSLFFVPKFGSFETRLISIFHSTEWSSHLDSDTLW